MREASHPMPLGAGQLFGNHVVALPVAGYGDGLVGSPQLFATLQICKVKNGVVTGGDLARHALRYLHTTILLADDANVENSKVGCSPRRGGGTQHVGVGELVSPGRDRSPRAARRLGG
ncbi:hypothetical protein GCM10010172_30190 [Paractinoplanes ferrugineus]|uniref:Uncharacterized protein n=1 Tax=Paractinoplanes ferrugineus TaxID=113564 RepID=A0A919MDB5_9ACTN|nr:hypothetical protein Afe05nite_74560 [Actinoplanes ferrugineus]